MIILYTKHMGQKEPIGKISIHRPLQKRMNTSIFENCECKFQILKSNKAVDLERKNHSNSLNSVLP